MRIRIPMKGEVVVCKECCLNQPQIYNDCERPCSWLISWVLHETDKEIRSKMRTWACEHRYEVACFGKIEFLTCVHCGRQLFRSADDEEWTELVKGREDDEV